MKSKNLPLKYILSTLFRLGKPYRGTIVFGYIFLALMAACVVATISLIRPLFNIANNSATAGLNTFNKIVSICDRVEPYFPLKDCGLWLTDLLPEFMQLGGHRTYVLITLIAAGCVLSAFTAIFQYFAYLLTHKVTLLALRDIRDNLNDVLINQHRQTDIQISRDQIMG